jgi:hypothetical protein
MANCQKCQDTGVTGYRFYADNPLCGCPVGQERATWAALTPAEQAERATAEGAEIMAAAAQRRQARRASRSGEQP